MLRWFTHLIAAVFVLAAASVASAQGIGPVPGDRLPAPLSAQDQTGAQRDLASLMGRDGLVLVFVRAADWCPYCQTQLVGLEGVRGEIEQRGWKLAAITTDTVEELARFAQRRSIGFPLLSDEPAAITRRFDLLDPTQPPNSRHNGVPVPTIFFVTSDGAIAARLGDSDYRIRPPADNVVATIDGLER